MVRSGWVKAGKPRTNFSSRWAPHGLEQREEAVSRLDGGESKLVEADAIPGLGSPSGPLSRVDFPAKKPNCPALNRRKLCKCAKCMVLDGSRLRAPESHSKQGNVLPVKKDQWKTASSTEPDAPR
jgi:hypothetical protein